MRQSADSIAGGRIFVIESPKNGKLEHVTQPETKSHTFDEAIDIAGFGRMGWQIFLASSLIMLAVINETMGISILIPAAHCDLNLSATDKGVLTGVSFAGIILTSHLWGYVADTKGRKNVIIASLVITTLCSLVSSMAVNFATIAVLRLLVGMCISAPSATIYAYLGEFTRTEKRTVMISFASVAVGLSYIYTGAFGWIVLSYDWRINILDLVEFRPWRLLFIIYSLPGAIGAVWLMFLPESPKFYISRGKDDKALGILWKIYVTNHPGAVESDFPVQRISPENGEIVDSIQQTGFLAILRSMWNQTVPLLKRPNLLYFTVCCALQFGMFVVSGGMGLWYPEIVNRVTKTNGSDAATICGVLREVDEPDDDFMRDATGECNDHVTSDVFIYVIALGIIYTFLYLAISTMLRTIRRGYILFINLMISGVSGISLVFINEPYAVLVLFCSFMVFAGISISVVNGAAVSLFSTNVRAMAVCLSLMMGRLGSVVGTNLIGLIMEENCNLTFILFGGCSLVGALLTLVLPSR